MSRLFVTEYSQVRNGVPLEWSTRTQIIPLEALPHECEPFDKMTIIVALHGDDWFHFNFNGDANEQCARMAPNITEFRAVRGGMKVSAVIGN